MAVSNGAYGSANNVTTTTAATFIPEVWSDEVIAAYKKNLVMANLVRKMNHKGKKGDTINIPMPSRAVAQAKGANATVKIQQDTESNVQVLINKHFEVSRLIEDIVSVQALSSLRRFYTDDAGYALAKRVDSSVIQLGRGVNGGDGTADYTGAYSGADGTTAYTGTAGALTDAAIRRSIQRLDDNDVPMDGRFLIVPPSSRNTLMGLARYTEQAFVGEVGSANTIRNGEIGNLYGIPVFVSSNADTATDGDRICLLGHKEFAVLVEQQGIRAQTQYKQEFLGTLFTSDTIYGVKELRDGSAVALAVPA